GCRPHAHHHHARIARPGSDAAAAAPGDVRHHRNPRQPCRRVEAGVCAAGRVRGRTSNRKDWIMTQLSEPAPTTRDGRLEYASPGVATASPISKPGKAAFIAGWIITTIIILWMGVLGVVIFAT